MTKEKDNKYGKLAIGLIADALGYTSFIIPGLGEFSDVIFAPFSAWLMTRLYKGKSGQVAAAVTFIEEIAPGLDVIPTFTLMWLYTYVFTSKKETIIEV
jgi:hypothetical protein